ncbi:hypothetical protein F441_03267 [Phytophthora nicotianae CJ01A1]|uniref:Uncharacterized protein n=1 Tax=Phytophthora nicotianae CJ01A1 TaxID=1317063 RepID=W2XL57_PHYNI|nr:hypothetical protein F441_03267 [Phytophthora nicotianae CJ01A1]
MRRETTKEMPGFRTRAQAQKKAAAKASTKEKPSGVHEKAVPAEEKTGGAQKKSSPCGGKATSRKAKTPGEKQQAPDQVPRMWRAAGDERGLPKPTNTPRQDERAVTAEVTDAVGDIIVTVAEETVDKGSVRHVVFSALTASRNPRRQILEGDIREDATLPSAEYSTGVTSLTISGCVNNGDPNLMTTGAEQCTDLNSDEGPDVREEPEEEEEEEEEEEDDDDDNDDDDGVGDGGDIREEGWSIGDLTDEDSDTEQEELPASGGPLSRKIVLQPNR